MSSFPLKAGRDLRQQDLHNSREICRETKKSGKSSSVQAPGVLSRRAGLARQVNTNHQGPATMSPPESFPSSRVHGCMHRCASMTGHWHICAPERPVLCNLGRLVSPGPVSERPGSVAQEYHKTPSSLGRRHITWPMCPQEPCIIPTRGGNPSLMIRTPISGLPRTQNENAFREDLSVVVNFAIEVAGSQERL